MYLLSDNKKSEFILCKCVNVHTKAFFVLQCFNFYVSSNIYLTYFPYPFLLLPHQSLLPLQQWPPGIVDIQIPNHSCLTQLL